MIDRVERYLQFITYLYEIASLKTTPYEDSRKGNRIAGFWQRVSSAKLVKKKGNKTYIYPVMKQNAARGPVD